MSTEHIPVVGDEASAEEKYEKRLKELEKANRGLIEDLQQERQHRHRMEQEIAPIRRAFRPEAEPAENRVERLAQDPDRYIQEAVKPMLSNSVSREELNRIFATEKAIQWLAKQEGIDAADLQGSDLEKDLWRIAKENNLDRLDPISGMKATHVFLQREREMKKNNEDQRDERILNGSTQPSPVSKPTGSPRFTDEQIRDMSSDEYEKHRVEILNAEQSGRIKVTLPAH